MRARRVQHLQAVHLAVADARLYVGPAEASTQVGDGDVAQRGELAHRVTAHGGAAGRPQNHVCSKTGPRFWRIHL